MLHSSKSFVSLLPIVGQKNRLSVKTLMRITTAKRKMTIK
ncbi:hypothetical protein EVA_12639 [gut metagenome]|uniref:Uncharacterized protein n=1 Tax=gut metagenome TaxID=749906 RepID=J9FW79_9ZZZZ